MITHLVAAPFSKFASVKALVNSLNRHVGLVPSYPELPPSPYMFCGQLFLSASGSLFVHVPLSCSPPWTSAGFEGLIATPMNCNVSRFVSTCVIRFGTRDNSRLQLFRLAAPSSGRSPELHRKDRSPNVPSVRITPPSEPSKIWVGFDGFTTIVCWSGWMLSGAQRQAKAGETPPNDASPEAPSEHQVAGWFCVSSVRSVKVRVVTVLSEVVTDSGSPAVVE